MILTLLAAWSALERPSQRSAALLGVAIGVTALVRSEALLLLPRARVAGRGARRNRLAVAGGARDARLRRRDRPVDDPQRDRVRPPGADLEQRLDGPARRELPAGVLGHRHRLLAASTASRRGARTTRRDQAATWRSTGPALRTRPRRAALVVVPVRILRTFSLYQPRRQVLFAEGRWIRGEQLAVASFFLLALLAVPGTIALRRSGVPLLVVFAPLGRGAHHGHRSATGIRACGTSSSLR